MPLTVALSLPEKVTSVRLLQLVNTDYPMLVTLSEIVTLLRPKHK